MDKKDYLLHYMPLHEAVFFGNIDAIEALLKNQADINARNKDDQTPLHIMVKAACRGQNAEVARYLVEKKAGIRKVTFLALGSTSPNQLPPRRDINCLCQRKLFTMSNAVGRQTRT
eukprot:4645803-Amphidinium_carterae.1